MKKEIAEKRVAALRSGKYKQTKRKLKNLEGYSWLGVLCEVVGKPPTKNEYGTYPVDGLFVLLPESVIMLSGMRSCSGLLPNNVSLSGL